ncbi:hypothetical protein [Metabacillus arenae]|uniref:Uncharacterized protein n=1 Tax=Metabacillus arenae TaxID=2771434 RepID=A0A926NGJ3_9BACI|nr:hypothetical protein [Metabacillus arenae]MBD1383039.1 hypothetical protein [Metabacillus arenae]
MSEEEKQENTAENEDQLNEQPKNEPGDFFSQMMFGSSKKKPKSAKPSDATNQTGQEIDYMELMNQLEDIYSSIQELKPLLSEFSPVVDYFKKKFKS